jgi:hypothetical protein
MVAAARRRVTGARHARHLKLQRKNPHVQIAERRDIVVLWRRVRDGGLEMPDLRQSYEWSVGVLRAYLSAVLLCVVGGGAGFIGGEFLTGPLGASAPVQLGLLGLAVGALASSSPEWMSLERKLRRLARLREAQAADAASVLDGINKLPAGAKPEIRDALVARYGDIYLAAATAQQQIHGVGQ